MKKEYLLTFSSYYKARYAQDKLHANGIKSNVKRAPTGLMTSCGYAIYVTTDDLPAVLNVFDGEILNYKNIFVLDSSSEEGKYVKLSKRS